MTRKKISFFFNYNRNKKNKVMTMTPVGNNSLEHWHTRKSLAKQQ